MLNQSSKLASYFTTFMQVRYASCKIKLRQRWQSGQRIQPLTSEAICMYHPWQHAANMWAAKFAPQQLCIHLSHATKMERLQVLANIQKPATLNQELKTMKYLCKSVQGIRPPSTGRWLQPLDLLQVIPVSGFKNILLRKNMSALAVSCVSYISPLPIQVVSESSIH